MNRSNVILWFFVGLLAASVGYRVMAKKFRIQVRKPAPKLSLKPHEQMSSIYELFGYQKAIGYLPDRVESLFAANLIKKYPESFALSLKNPARTFNVDVKKKSKAPDVNVLGKW